MGFAKSTKVQVVGGAIVFYLEPTLGVLYEEKPFSTNVHTITITNDSDPDVGNDPCQVSFDGATRKGDIKAGESMSYNLSTKTSVFVKGTAGGENVRIWGW